jgi:hypothetical protein
MGRKKSYKKDQPKPPKPAAAPAAGAADDDEDDAPESAAAPDISAGEAAGEGPAIVPEVIAAPGAEGAGAPTFPGRPEWATYAPQRLEAAEDDAFWFAFALAVMGCAPGVLSIAAAILAAVLGARIVRALYSAPTEAAPDDLPNARMLCFGTAFIAAMYKASQIYWAPMLWMFICVFWFNALRNARIMVGIAARGGPKRAKRLARQAAQKAAIEAGAPAVETDDKDEDDDEKDEAAPAQPK